MKLYLDTESAGLKGPLHLIQYSIGRGDIKMVRPFQEDCSEILSLFNCEDNYIFGYNIGHDIFKLYQHFKPDKAFKCHFIDLYQHFLRSYPANQYPFGQKRPLINLNRIPYKHADRVEKTVVEKIKSLIPPFAQVKVKRSLETEPGEKKKKGKEAKLVSFSFSIPFSAKLKDISPIFSTDDSIKIEEVFKLPKDHGWKEDTRYPFVMWDEKERYQKLWEENEKILDDPNSKAWEYSRRDIELLYALEDWLNQFEEVKEDYNDICTHIVAYTKYFGFNIDLEKTVIEAEKTDQALYEIEHYFEETEKKIIHTTLFEEVVIKKGLDLQSSPAKLEWLRNHSNLPLAVVSSDERHIEMLMQTDILTEEGKEGAKRMMKYKPLWQKKKQLEVFLMSEDGRVHPDFRVYGTSTNRMAGTGGINFHGVSREDFLRRLLLTSQGGDFDGLEVVLAATAFKDEVRLEELKRGIDPHLMAAKLLLTEFSEYSYDELLEIKKDKNHPKFKWMKELRAKGKQILFALLYFCSPYKIAEILNLTPEEAEKVMEEKFFSHYESMGRTRKEFKERYCTADFDTWRKDSVGDMLNHASNLYGEKRYITFEREMADFFWGGCDEIAFCARGDKEIVLRSRLKGEQNIQQAIRSACLGAASQMQQAIYRQLGNYPIQSLGAATTKMLMACIWDVFHVPMMNIHDEIIIPQEFNHLYDQIKERVDHFIEQKRKAIPYLSMGWQRMKNWGEK